MFSEQQISILE